jgi:pilus assembly protein CpaB
MRSRRTLIVFVLAIACGLVAGYSVLQLLQRQPAPLQVENPRSSQQVAVAREDLPRGHVLGEEDVRVIDWPGDAVPEGYSRSVAEVVGRALITPVHMNEPLLDAKLTGRGSGGGMAAVVPEGMRAVPIRVDEIVGVAGFVGPGDRVDVLLSTNSSDGEAITRTVMQNLEVLARDQTMQPDAQGTPQLVTTLTMAVTPEQAEQLTLATSGRIQLALRNNVDMREVRTPGARMSGLLNPQGGTNLAARASSRLPAPQAEDNKITIEMFKGGKRSLIEF